MATVTLPEAEIKEKKISNKQSATKYVYFFGGGKADGNGKMKDVLGGKGAGLAEMTNAGLPVPPGFTIQTDACREYMRGGLSPDVDRQMDEALAKLESLQGQKLGQGEIAIIDFPTVVQEALRTEARDTRRRARTARGMIPRARS